MASIFRALAAPTAPEVADVVCCTAWEGGQAAERAPASEHRCSKP
jgi:hypothetical protein